MSEMFKKFWWSRPVQWFCEPIVACWCLLLLFILTFFGTVYQVGHGLFEAKRVFFDSYWFFAGVMPQSMLDLFDPQSESKLTQGIIAVLKGIKWVLTYVPFPGTQLVLGVLSVNLFAYMINMLLMPKMKFGIVLIHAGLIAMLVGGAVTHHYAEESQLTLGEGEAGNVTAGYHAWEVALVRDAGDGRHDVRALDAEGLKAGDVLDFGVPGLRVTVEQYFESCLVDGAATAGEVELSRMHIWGLRAVPKNKEPERNIAGGIFSVKGEGDAKRFLLFGESDVAVSSVSAGGKDYWLVLRHKRFTMPMTIQLADFNREMHPGTSMAASYSSKVKLLADGTEREITISMNKPLRHRGYTLYQASFNEDQRTGAQYSTFAVVHNYGRLLPYISTGIIVLGMVWHFVVMLVKRAKRQEAKV